MKKILVLLTLCAFAFGASECDKKIDGFLFYIFH